MSSRALHAIAGVVTIDDLLGAFAEYLALPSCEHIVFALAVAVSASFDGDPLWGLLVGAPASGKTETLRALDGVADERLDEITAAGLLSWLPSRPPRPTGLLARRQGCVFATIGDLSTLLAMSDRGTRDLLYALLRRAHDGEVVRELGNAPEPLRWQGRLTLLAAVTPAVDRYGSHEAALGPRWLYLRLRAATPEQRRAAARLARMSSAALKGHRARARTLAREIVREARARPVATINGALGKRLDEAAQVTCLGRAVVPRDGYGKREIIDLPTIEEPPRIAGQLAHLARGALALGLDEQATAALCTRSALDSMPLARREALAALASGQHLSIREAARRIGASHQVVRIAFGDLEAIGVAHNLDERGGNDETRRGPWMLDGDNAALITRVFADPEKCDSTPRPPEVDVRHHTVRDHLRGGE